jgi:hypothetical protein
MAYAKDLPVTDQNEIALDAVFTFQQESRRAAEEAGKTVNDYLLEDYQKNPEGWDRFFRYPLYEISEEAKLKRKDAIRQALKD